MIHLPRTLKLIVVGTGHSGTTWATEVLQRGGMNAWHEQIFQDTIVEPDEWPKDIEAEVSCKAVPHLREVPHEVRVVHLTRHPLATIRSLYYCPTSWAYESKEWVQGELGMQLPSSNKLDYLVAFYVAWTNKIDESANDTCKVEDGAMKFSVVCRCPRTVAVDIPPIGNRAKPDAPKMTWADIPDNDMKERLLLKAIKYKYETRETATRIPIRKGE